MLHCARDWTGVAVMLCTDPSYLLCPLTLHYHVPTYGVQGWAVPATVQGKLSRPNCGCCKSWVMEQIQDCELFLAQGRPHVHVRIGGRPNEVAAVGTVERT